MALMTSYDRSGLLRVSGLTGITVRHA